MTHRLIVPLSALALAGCKVVDAPSTMEDVAVYGFAHYDDDPEYLVDTQVELVPLVDANVEALAEGYRISQLTTEDLEAAGIEGADVSQIMGAMGMVDYRHDLDSVLEIATHEHKDEVFDTTLAYEVSETTDRECFLAHECERLDQTITETTELALLGEATRTFKQSFRWVELEDGTLVVHNRTTSPDPISFSSNLMRVDQQYAFVSMYPNGDVARRVEAFWVDAEIIGMDVPDTFAVDNAVGQMAKTAEKIDDALDGEEAE